MKNSKDRRKKYLINKKFQVKLILYFVLLVILGNIISGLLLYYLTSSELESSFFKAHVSIGNAWETMKPLIVTTQFYVLLVMTIATVFLVLYSSHRIAGPLYRLQKAANEVKNGNLEQTLTIRKKDELQQLIISFQQMVDNFRNKFLELQNNLSEIRKFEPSLENAIITSSIPENEKNVLSKSFKNYIVRYQEILNALYLPKQ